MASFDSSKVIIIQLSLGLLSKVSDDEPEAPEEASQSPGKAPPSPDYVPGPEHLPSPDYVPGPEYPEYLVPSDNEAPIEDQPLPADASPTTLSMGYVADFDLEEVPEEDPADYPTDERDDNDDDDDDKEEEEKSFEDDDDKDEEEEHLALADSVIKQQPPMTASIEALIAEFVFAPTPPSPPPSSLSPLSSPLPHIPSPPLPVLSPPLPLLSPPTHTSPTYAEAPLGYIAAMIRSRAASPSTHHPSEIPSPPLFEVGESSSAAAARQTRHTLAHKVDYRFIDTMDASIRASESRAMTVMGEANKRVTNLDITQRQEAQELHTDEPHSARAQKVQRASAHCKGGTPRIDQLMLVKGTDVLSYNQRFQELALMCERMFPEESDEVEKYVDGLLDMIQESLMEFKPKTMQDVIEFANEPIYQKICTFTNRQAENKRRLDDNSRNNQNQASFQKAKCARAYTAGHEEKKVYGGSKPLCPKCNYHHDGQCAPEYTNYKRIGHLARDCRSPAATANNQRAFVANQRIVTYFECGVQGHYNKDCPKLKNNNLGNQAGNTRATARAYAVGNAGKTQTPMSLRVRSF
nr:hypothetical protein [Tanacetum cinerariifolium]